MRVAPAGTVTCPFLPTAVKRLPSTMKAESSIGALPSAVMSRAPSNTVAPAAGGVWPAAGSENTASRSRPAKSAGQEACSRRITLLLESLAIVFVLDATPALSENRRQNGLQPGFWTCPEAGGNVV